MNRYTDWGWGQQVEYEQDLEIIYKLDAESGFENAYSKEVAQGTGLYGELDKNAVEHMLEHYRDYFSNRNGAFYDLGSGTGKVVSHVALRSQLSKVCGIELDKIRFDKSKKLIDTLSFPHATPEIINGDFFDQDYSDATVMYFDNTMWNEHFENDRSYVDRLFKTIKPGTLIMTKELIPHIVGHARHLSLPTSYDWTPAYALVFLAFRP